MSIATASASPDRAVPGALTPRRLAVVRAVLALLWAVAVLAAVGDDVPRTGSAVPAAAAALLAAYPLIDVVASLLGAGAPGAARRALRVNAAVGVVAAGAVGLAAFGADAGATLAAFGAWAVVAGALQLAVALRRRSTGRGLPMVLSGALSAVAGLGFVAAGGRAEADLRMLAGYMVAGAVFFLVWAARDGAAS